MHNYPHRLLRNETKPYEARLSDKPYRANKSSTLIQYYNLDSYDEPCP